MEVSKVTLTNEFKEKTRKPLGNVKKRELRLKMLAKSEADGSLSKAKNRYEVANLAGFTAKQKQSGYLWVYKQVKEGKIAEHIMNYLPNGKAEYEYHVIDTTSMPRKDSVVKKNTEETDKKFLDFINQPEEQNEIKPKATIRMSDEAGELDVELEGYAPVDVALIIKEFMKNE